MVQETEVLICGSGSAGLAAATWLAIYNVPFRMLERRDGPMKMGQADGVQCRTVEVFESLGISEELLRESYHVLEVAFWDARGKGNQLRRTKTTADTEKGLSHQPHVILNQARINGLLIERMKRAGGTEVDYGWQVKSVVVDEALKGVPDAKAVTVVAERDGKEEEFRARYVLGCDGAHSSVRRSLGYKMVGDTSDAVWGVMDVYPRTNFPDIRRKATLHSDSGALLIIPREGGSLVRFYIELPAGTNAKDVKLEDLHSAAKKCFGQYTMDIVETYWWSAYSIGQRLADFFSKDNRVFLTGDACHTHSPKAGQGMNVSLQDGYNIGWKLGMILTGQAGPDLLTTYNIEREKVAKNLIEFDRRFTKAFSAKHNHANGEDDDPESFSREFIMAGRYTAGLTATYDDSSITSAQGSDNSLAKGLVVGMRFPSAQVVRHCDAKAMQLVRALPADGRWRIVVFAGDIRYPSAEARLNKLGEYLDSEAGPARTFTPPDGDIDSFIEPIVVLAGERNKIEQEQIHSYFWPATGKWGMRDLHKLFVDDESYNSGHGHAYEKYVVDPTQGAVAIVRPDQYVSKVVALDDFDGIGNFFKSFAIAKR